MSVQEIEKAIESLSEGELAEIEAWFANRQSDRWDEQIERDSASGKLNHLIEKAQADFKQGKCTPM